MKQLKLLRKQKGLTQKELAEKLGVGRTTVTLWETEVNTPRSSMLPKIARVLSCTVDDLLCPKT